MPNKPTHHAKGGWVFYTNVSRETLKGVNMSFNLQTFYEQIMEICEIASTVKINGHICQLLTANDGTSFHVFIDLSTNMVDRIHVYK